ncbi:copper chaperone CopZ [Lederbergia lenta]|uniref:Copper chaperone CopZ n=1 Tax=Lederbergia lenta TaxID=1467 RepID=A0A2X4WG56_LEDLE|nr:copper chaperone CopZ [Lederbergia lenta]MCM3113039.1 copper chaperone CopZ [Lederbergia lenta]MEC2322767.1 copper chaperone CopZ [Lederbergia lenta]SQI61809.1 copper chaperon [Lederbergia lenta]
MNKATIKITGMSCAHCVNKIETALQDLQGVVKAKVNLKKEIAKVKYDETVQSTDSLTAAIKEVGYEAEPVR